MYTLCLVLNWQHLRSSYPWSTCKSLNAHCVQNVIDIERKFWSPAILFFHLVDQFGVNQQFLENSGKDTSVDFGRAWCVYCNGSVESCRKTNTHTAISWKRLIYPNFPMVEKQNGDCHTLRERGEKLYGISFLIYLW